MATVALLEGPVVSGPLLDEFDFARPEAVWKFNGSNAPVAIEIARHGAGGPVIAFRSVPS